MKSNNFLVLVMLVSSALSDTLTHYVISCPLERVANWLTATSLLAEFLPLCCLHLLIQ